MSGALIREHIVKIVDPRTDLAKPLKYVVEDGSSSVTWVNSDSNMAGGNASQFTFSNANPPGSGVIIDKKVWIRMGFRITFTGTPAAGIPLIGYEAIPDPTVVGYANAPVNFIGNPLTQIRPLGTDGPRAFPAAQSMNSISVTINNATVTQPVFDYIEPLLRYNAFRDLDETQFSTTPAEQDQYQQYGDFVYHGSARNVLGDYGEQGFYTNRGGFAGVAIIQNPLGIVVGGVLQPATAIIDIDVMEPLFISPLDFGMNNERGLIGVQNFQVSVNLVGALDRAVWCHDAINGQVIATSSAIVGTYKTPRPQLQFNYLTPKLTQSVPQINIFPYFNIDRFTKEGTASVAGVVNGAGGTVYSTGSFTSDSRNLLCIPKRMYFYVREVNSLRTIAGTDTYARIDNLSIDFINKNNLINGANTQQLYEMSVKNGCKLSWSQWNNYVGSVCCVDFSQDVSLTEDQAVGLIDPNLQIRVTVNFTNLSTRAITFALYMVPSYPGLFNMSEQQAVPQIGIVTKEDIVLAPNTHIDYYDAHNFYGGDFFGKTKELARKYFNAKDIANAADAVLPSLVGFVSPGREQATKEFTQLFKHLVGAGYTREKAMRMARKVHGGGPIGSGAMIGGRKMSKKSMAANRKHIMQRAIGY
jgi:hypothetical protein